VPKGEFGRDEDPLTAARREFEEETGFPINGEFTALAPIKQPGGKTIHVWAIAGDCNHRKIHSNTFTMEWPPRSGKVEEFPEVDRAQWFDISEARLRIVSGQLGFLNELEALLNAKATLR